MSTVCTICWYTRCERTWLVRHHDVDAVRGDGVDRTRLRGSTSSCGDRLGVVAASVALLSDLRVEADDSIAHKGHGGLAHEENWLQPHGEFGETQRVDFQGAVLHNTPDRR